MKKVAIIGNADFSGTQLFASTTDNSTSSDIIINEVKSAVYEIKNYRVEPIFFPSKKVKSKYKRNLKYR